MVIYYTAEKTDSGAFLEKVLEKALQKALPEVPEKHGGASQILRSENGKPYLEKGECEFSLTDTDGLVAVAVGAQRVGLDAERRKPRKLDAILSRLTPAEREEDFFELWTAKEAYVKYLGGTLARLLPHLEYKKGVLYFKDAPVDVQIKHFALEGCTVCLCTAQEEPFTLVRL